MTALTTRRTNFIIMANQNNVKSIPIGTRFGALVVVGVGAPKVYGNKRNSTSICRCDCGNVVTYTNNVLKRGRATSCGDSTHKKKEIHCPKYLSKGYVFIYEPLHPKANNAGYVREHVLIMEKYLGRYLNEDEVVHHRDFNRSNNKLSNLQLMTRSTHTALHSQILVTQFGKHFKSERVCRICGSPTSKYGVLCKKCALSLRKKVNLPDISTLQEWVDKFTLEEVSRKVGITSNALRKWLRKLHVSYTPKKSEGNISACQTKEAREKCRLAQIKYFETHTGNGSIPIGQFDMAGNLIRRYESIAEVSSFGFVKTCVSRVVSGKRKHHRGFLWKKI